MTTKQQEIRDQVHELLSEHFDGFAYGLAVQDVDDGTDHEIVTGYHGGSALGIGLATCVLDDIRHDLETRRGKDED